MNRKISIAVVILAFAILILGIRWMLEPPKMTPVTIRKVAGDRNAQPSKDEEAQTGSMLRDSGTEGGSAGAKDLAARKEVHRRLVENIRRALEAKRAAKKQAPTGDGEGDETPVEERLEQEYLGDAIRGILPHLRQCYQSSLEQNPEMAGKMYINFTIAGDPEVGGIIEKSSVDTSRFPDVDATFANCIHDAVYDMEELPAPSGCGSIDVTIPIVFRTVE